jgi:hypothetical protein
VKALIGWALVAGFAVYALELRPRWAHWGATEAEFAGPLSGDERFPGQRLVSTRAITIDATPDEVWPWLVQMGHGRAGFYSHDWLERALGMAYVDKHSAIRIHPELQGLREGDSVPYHPFLKVPVEVFDPPRTLIAGEWFVLRALPNGQTRVLVRTRGGWFERLARTAPIVGWLLLPLAAVIDRVPGELLHHYMESGMLRGLKARVEQSGAARAG